MTDRDQVLHFIARARDRVDGGSTEHLPEIDAVRYARERLLEAFEVVDPTSTLPADVRLRAAKQAALRSMRPFTLDQVTFNQRTLAAVDGTVGALERLARQVDRQDQRTSRLQAGVAATDLTIDDLVNDLQRLTQRVGELQAEVADLRSQLGDHTS